MNQMKGIKNLDLIIILQSFSKIKLIEAEVELWEVFHGLSMVWNTGL